jgi:hypothetical protein
MSVAAVGGIYELVRFSSANLREKDDALNTAYGGFLAGTVLGLRRKVWTGPYLQGDWLIYFRWNNSRSTWVWSPHSCCDGRLRLHRWTAYRLPERP